MLNRVLPVQPSSMIYLFINICFFFLGWVAILGEAETEDVEAKPEVTDEPEGDDSDVPDNELGAVMEFDEDQLDEAQTEADVKNITNKHQITLEELKREVLGSVRKHPPQEIAPELFI